MDHTSKFAICTATLTTLAGYALLIPLLSF